MIDCFELLDEPRQPWLDPERLKEKFLALSAASHPDRVHSAADTQKDAALRRYTDLSAAYNRLRDPKERLQHLLELELGTRPQQVQNISPDLMDLFMEVSQLLKEIDSFLAEKAATNSPLLRIPIFERGQIWTEKLVDFRRQLECRREGLVAELKDLNTDWRLGTDSDPAGRSTMLHRLENLYGRLSYYGRWGAQIQERILQLSI